mmetsp:Transcript_19771/g.56834  ORF Transcript_19771/g.56834 Transcript_19771/m.56834 type:complete len:245 (-) Transcript_19771:202-936(-)
MPHGGAYIPSCCTDASEPDSHPECADRSAPDVLCPWVDGAAPRSRRGGGLRGGLCRLLLGSRCENGREGAVLEQLEGGVLLALLESGDGELDGALLDGDQPHPCSEALLAVAEEARDPPAVGPCHAVLPDAVRRVWRVKDHRERVAARRRARLGQALEDGHALPFRRQLEGAEGLLHVGIPIGKARRVRQNLLLNLGPLGLAQRLHLGGRRAGLRQRHRRQLRVLERQPANQGRDRVDETERLH